MGAGAGRPKSMSVAAEPATQMLKVDQVMDIKELKQQGHSIRAIARITGHSRNTVTKVLRGEHSTAMKPHQRQSKLDPFVEYVTKRYEESQLSAVRILEEIRPMGFDGSIDTLRRFVRGLKGETRRRAKLTVRFETAPGKQAQADWAYCGKFDTPSGKRVSIYAFVIVLAYPRQLFVHFTTSMRMPELLRCHQLAFEFFGGWPDTILYDNMKQVRLSRNEWNEQFLDFASHYGFTPKTHRPYRPRTKGKVERAVDYVKRNFLQGREFEGLEGLNAAARRWLETTANVRTHGTTQERPCDRFEDEKDALTKLSSAPVYNYVDPVQRIVSWESMVRFRGSRYSVPPEHAGKSVFVSSEGGQVFVRMGDTVIAEHAEATRPDQCIVEREHLAELWRLVDAQTPSPGSTWDLKFSQTVEQAPLATYEELAP